ncbi:hypothetical protein DPMN_055879 [Dreissena polymorpha]|uniref:Uncharacterized protein n=1 Tax=Dreissena polymorpha TaxID=45954 RepID=A0A9D4CS63_DREPO|nr:hypothetical protein DPMN_055879 [Dreissena polymorpha]
MGYGGDHGPLRQKRELMEEKYISLGSKTEYKQQANTKVKKKITEAKEGWIEEQFMNIEQRDYHRQQ